MSLKASPKSTPTKNIPKLQTMSIDRSHIYKTPSSQDIEILLEKPNSNTSKLPTSRLVQIGFYDPDDNLISPVKEVHIEAKTLLNKLVSTLQDLLDVSTAAVSRERLQTKSIQLRILDHESYQNFPWPKSEVKSDNYELGCNGKLIWDLLESIDSNWTNSREILLKHDENLKKIGHPILVVQTVRGNEDTNSLPAPISRTDYAGILNRKLEMEPNFKKEDDQEYSAVRLPEISIGTKIHNEKIKDEDETNSMKLIDENKNDIEDKIEYRGKDYIPKQIDEKVSTQIENPNRKPEGDRIIKIQEKHEEEIPSLFQCQITGPSELWIEEQNKQQTNNIFSIKNLQLSEDIKKENSKEQIILSSESTTPCWSDCDEVTEDELSTQNGYFKNRKDSHKDFRSGKISPRSSRDLEIYRRFHESAISYANEDEEAFFPSTPKSIPEVYIVDETRKTLSEKHQATQLDLDKIVKDAVVRKLNKIRHGYLDPLASPIFNPNEDMIYDQQALYSQGFNQDMSISQEHNELQQLELMYGYNLCEQGDNFFSQNSPSYFMSPSAKDYSNMLGVNPEQNLINDYGTNSLNYMSHNLPYINGAVANYPNNGYNLDNLVGLPYTNPYTLGNPGAYLLNKNHQLGPGNSNFNPTYMLKNQMNIPSPLMWNRTHSNWVF